MIQCCNSLGKKCKCYKALYSAFNSTFYLHLTLWSPLCIAYIINLYSPVWAKPQRSKTNVSMPTNTVCLWWNEEEEKDLVMGSNVIMQGLAGATVPITAVLGLIKTQPPQSITIYMFMDYTLEGWLHCVLLFVLCVALCQICLNNHFLSLLYWC